MLLIVEIALACHAIHALVAVEEIRGTIPNVAQRIDVEFVAVVALDHDDLALVWRRISDLGVADAVVFEILAQLLLVLVRNLDDHTGVLGEEHLHDVVALRLHVVEVDMQATLCVGKGHLQQCGDETAGTHVVTCHDPSLADELLHGIEAVGEVLAVLHRRHVAADAAEALREGRSAEALLVEAEVYII